ncbi:MAG: dipeptidase PepV [Oscillospiraceae bacterium]|nr:dipeptidase PepV [Oscillospiraceae bacterium]
MTGQTKPSLKIKKILKYAAAAIAIAASVYLIVRLMPWFASLAEEQARSEFLEYLDSFGIFGVFVMLGIQLLQVVVAVLPGEPIEVLFGILYGTFGGLLLCLLGLLFGYFLIYYSTKKLFAENATQKLKEKFGDKNYRALSFIRNSRNVSLIYFILYFIPGTPKDLLTYIAPFTPIKPLEFFLIATFARIPSIITSTYAGASLGDGEFKSAIIVFAITGALGILGIIFNQQILSLLKKVFHRGGKEHNMNFGENITSYREEIIENLGNIVKIKSVREEPKEGKPFGEGPYNALQYALSLAESLGFKAVNLDGYVGYAEYGEGDEYIAVISHLDVVPEGTGWDYPPYGAVIEDGRLYGRGASDNKCAAILGLYAMKTLVDNGVVPNRRIRLIFGCCEETGMEDLEYYFSKEPYPALGFTPDSGYPIVNAEKGILTLWFTDDYSSVGKIVSVDAGSALNIVPQYCTAVLNAALLSENELKMLEDAASDESYSLSREDDLITINATGKYAHGASPENGINAIGLMSLLLGALSGDDAIVKFMRFIKQNIGMEYYAQTLGAAREDDISGKLTFNMGAIHMEDGKIKLGINIRYPVTVCGDDVVADLQKAADANGITLESIHDSAPLHVPADTPWIAHLAAAYKAITGEEAQLIAIGGGTYSRYTKNTCVGFGGTGANCHGTNEYVELDDLMRHGTIMTQALYNLSNID